MAPTWEQRSEEVKRRVGDLASMHLEWRKVSLAAEHFELATCSGAEILLNELVAADPSSVAVRDERLPYWTEVWPSALAVSQYVLEEEPGWAGRRVLDLGCGLGLTGVSAGRRGAKVVLCDYDWMAVRFAALNWVANVDTSPAAVVMDWRAPALCAGFDCILAADIVYEKRFFDPVIDAFDRLLKPGGFILLGEPNRQFSSGFFEVLQSRNYRFTKSERTVYFPNPTKPTLVNLYRITKWESAKNIGN